MNESTFESGDPSAAVVRLDESAVDDVVGVLCDSFRDYPVMRFVIGPVRDYDDKLRSLIHFFAMARVFRGETMLGVRHRAGLGAAALVSGPDGGQSPETLSKLRERVWMELGAEARERYEAFGEATARFDVGAPNLHLHMIGVARDQKGTGLGRKLLEAVHRMSERDTTSTGVTLTTESRANLALYEHFGYRRVGHGVVAPDLETWGFFRPDQGDGMNA